MYGKLFSTAFTGSMYGSGAIVFAVWGYIIANTDSASRIELNPRFLAPIIGEEQAKITTAIQFLCDPDTASRSKKEDGRRLIREGEYQYFVVNHQDYRNVRNEDERREYNRAAKADQRKREKESELVAKCQSMSNGVAQDVNDCQ